MVFLAELTDVNLLRTHGHPQTGCILLAIGIFQHPVPFRTRSAERRRRVPENVIGHWFEQRRQSWPQPFRCRETPLEKTTEKMAHRVISSR